MGFPRQEYWSVLAFPPPGDLPDPGMKPSLLRLLSCQVSSLSLKPPGEKKSIEHQLDFVWWTDFDLHDCRPIVFVGQSYEIRMLDNRKMGDVPEITGKLVKVRTSIYILKRY